VGYLTTSDCQLCKIGEGKNVIEGDLLNASDVWFLKQVGGGLEPRLSMFVVKFEHLVEGSLSNLARNYCQGKMVFLPSQLKCLLSTF